MLPWKYAIASAALAVGCGTTVVDSDSGGTGGSGASGGTGGTPDVCAAFLDEPSSGAVTLRFVNQTGQTLYMPAGCDGPSYFLSYTEGGEALEYGYDDSGCFFTCEYWQESSDAPLCSPCEAGAVMIADGDSIEVVWDGTGIAGVDDMPASCWADPQLAQGGCTQRKSAPFGEYSAFASAWSECEGCVCNDGLNCHNGTPSGLEATSDAATILHPEDDTVDIVFGGCAFGCP